MQLGAHLLLGELRAGGALDAVPVEHAEKRLLGVVGKAPVGAHRILVRLAGRLGVQASEGHKGVAQHQAGARQGDLLRAVGRQQARSELIGAQRAVRGQEGRQGGRELQGLGAAAFPVPFRSPAC